MDKTGQSLLKLLFNEGESICVSNNEFGSHSIPLETVLSGEVTLKSPNETVDDIRCHSSDLILVAMNPINGFRRDCQVTAFRTYLIELDFGTIKEQLGTIRHLKMPFSAQVFSGNKSIHTMIVLDEDLKDEKTYREIGNWIFNVVSQCDQNCKNPSRSVRIPGAYREPGKKQRLVEIKTRVSHAQLFEWLNKYKHLMPLKKEPRIVPPGQANFSLLSTWARNMLTKGIVFKKGRNQTFYGLATDLALAGFSEDQAIDVLLERFVEEHDFKEKELLTTIKSAFRTVQEGK